MSPRIVRQLSKLSDRLSLILVGAWIGLPDGHPNTATVKAAFLTCLGLSWALLALSGHLKRQETTGR